MEILVGNVRTCRTREKARLSRDQRHQLSFATRTAERQPLDPGLMHNALLLDQQALSFSNPIHKRMFSHAT